MTTHRTERSMHRRVRNGRMARGFTLVEVMVALIIIAIGMLGIAKMQAIALSSTGASRSRALAAIEASSLAAAMHANRSYWASGSATPGTIAVATVAGTGTVTSNDATMQTALTAAGVPAAGCTTGANMNAALSCVCATGSAPSPCTTYVNMAASDLYDWSAGLGAVLPAATATVACTNTNIPVDCTISLQWTENSVAMTQTQATAAKANASNTKATTAALQYVTYVLNVVP